jgi:hypothetical protein
MGQFAPPLLVQSRLGALERRFRRRGKLSEALLRRTKLL